MRASQRRSLPATLARMQPRAWARTDPFWMSITAFNAAQRLRRHGSRPGTCKPDVPRSRP
jgi:hypothetical protein